MKHILLFCFLTIISINSCFAGFTGKIQSIAAGPNWSGTILVRVENHSATAPWSAACSTNGFWSFKFDSSAPGGKETYSLLLAAYASQAKVVIDGTGACTANFSTDIQNLSYVRFDF